MGVSKEETLKGIAEAAERMGLDLEDLVEMIPDVLEDGLEKSKKILASIEAKDWSVVKDVAHDIKGAFRNYGLDAAGELAYQIESDPSADSNTEIVNNLIQLVEEISSFNIA